MISDPPAHVLVVDDKQQVVNVVERMLRKADYRVTSTLSARQALQLISDDDVVIDLLLTDVRMPEMSGQVLAERARAARPTLPILFMSGYDDFDTEGTPFGERMLAKPFSMEQLLTAVAGRLEQALADRDTTAP